MATVRTVTRIPLGGIAGDAHFHAFDGLSGPDHFAIRFGARSPTPIVRIHSECITGDLFGSLKCDCGSQLQHAIRVLDKHGGWLLYLRQEGRGIGLAAKLAAYALQESGLDTFEANRELGYADDERDYADAAAMLHALQLRSIALMTANWEKVDAIQLAGIKVRRLVACPGLRTPFNASYLDVKGRREKPPEAVEEVMKAAV
jgi:GTP cyclohydrolase II